ARNNMSTVRSLRVARGRNPSQACAGEVIDYKEIVSFMSKKSLRIAVVLFSILGPSSSVALAQKKGAVEESDKHQLELKACGPKEKEVMFKAGTDKNTHSTPGPPEGKAIIYVVRPTLLGNKVQTKLALDGDW